MRLKGSVLVFLWLLIVPLAASGYAQSLQVGTIEGKVVDQSGAVVPGVTVTLTGNDYVGHAVTKTVTATSSTAPVLVTSLHPQPGGYRLTAAQVERIAAANGYEPLGARVGEVLVRGTQAPEHCVGHPHVALVVGS